jgi:hypothetical protein
MKRGQKDEFKRLVIDDLRNVFKIDFSETGFSD